MDKNSIIGILLITAIIIGYSILTQPSQEELEAAKRRSDSIARVQAEEEMQRQLEIEQRKKQQTAQVDTQTGLGDSVKQEEYKKIYGDFAGSVDGENEFITIENELIKVKLSTLGGKVYSVKLKEFSTHDSLDLVLFDGDNNQFGFNFFAQNRSVATDQLFYELVGSRKEVNATNSAETVALRLNAGENRYLEHVYTLEPNSYSLKFNINLVGMDKVIASNVSSLDLTWRMDMPRQEKGADWETQNSTVYYKYYQDEPDYLTERSDEEEEELPTRVRWVSFKDQFFSSALIADEYFSNGYVKFVKYENQEKYIKNMHAELSIPYKGHPKETFPMKFYFGPNQYKILKGYDLMLERLIPLGWGIFGWVNRLVVIPLFNFLGSIFSSYGLIILLLTIIIKIGLFPLTFKSYQSTAKMRVLKPQIEEINKKIPKEKAMERQQATMALYKKVGVNPMGGCIPMALQFPILIAMFRFFPSSIELRQQGFLWATDLSSYDSILDLPFEIPFYGDHVSLFTLLMAGSIILTTKINSGQMDTNSQMPGMKTMMYLMPVMMLFWFNNYSSGLSYYYFISNIITYGQTVLIRRFVDDEAILKKLNEASAKKKTKPQSNFQKRLEDMAKKRGYQPPKPPKKKK